MDEIDLDELEKHANIMKHGRVPFASCGAGELLALVRIARAAKAYMDSDQSTSAAALEALHDALACIKRGEHE